MKVRILKVTTILLLFVIMEAGCEKAKEDNAFARISPNSKNTVIQKSIDGIDFKFGLMNTESEYATVFNEGENIIFNFSFSNDGEDTIIISTDFINNDFYRVFNSDNNKDMGKPWTGIWCEYSLQPQVIVLPPSQSREIKCPWILRSSHQTDYPLCKSESRPLLDLGDYYTKLNFVFEYDDLSSNDNK